MTLREILTNPRYLQYASIPLIAGLIGWITNWLAIKMTFLPLNFVGIRPIFGWQGIIPAKATKMATIFVDKTMYKLGKLSEIFEAMDPREIAGHVIRYIDSRIEEYVEAIMLEHNRVLWENLPQMIREQILATVRGQIPQRVESLMAEIGERIEELVDLKHMVIEVLERDKQLLNEMFIESGRAEFRFLIKSGAYFGFLFGLLQLTAWIFYRAAWVLPVCGAIVGYATNWLALNLIFRPLHPRKVGPWTLQGMFLRRQGEVAAVWCKIVTSKILTLPHVIRCMTTGPRADRTRLLIHKHIKPVVDEAVGGAVGKTIAQLTVGPGGYSQIKESVVNKAVDVSLEPFQDQAFTAERAAQVERLMRERMEALPVEDFQNLLRPCFQEDEFKLILIGGVLGMLAGLGQIYFM